MKNTELGDEAKNASTGTTESPRPAPETGFMCDRCGEWVDRPRLEEIETCTPCRNELDAWYSLNAPGAGRGDINAGVKE